VERPPRLGPRAGGVWDLIGGGVAEAIKRGNPGASVTLVPGGGVSDVGIVSKDTNPALGLSHSVLAAAAANGSEPFTEKVTNVKAIAALYISMQQCVAPATLEINSIKEIATKKFPIKVAVDEPGSIQYLANQKMLGEAGLTFAGIEANGGKVYLKGQNEASDLLTQGTVNLFCIVGPAPQSPIQEPAATEKLKMVAIDPELIEAMVTKYGYVKATVPKSAYDFMTADYPTFASKVIIIANDVMTEAEAYAITKALVENLDFLHGVHNNLAKLEAAFMADTVMTLHPGALKYYKEIGAVK
jgi:TRAP transporter TAXI family solute receptor